MIDVHVHLFPPGVFRAIWDFFETESRGLWPIRYKLHGRAHVEMLRAEGVSRFTSLVYAHKPGLAPYLNDFVRSAAAEFPEIIPFGTIYAGDGDCEGVARTIFEEYGFFGIKLHPFVSNEAIDDARLFPAYEVMEALGKVLVCHPGSAPVYGESDGAGRLRRVLERFSRLKVVVAHCGAYEYGDYTRLADEYETVYFDTAMNCVHTPVFENNCPGREFFHRYRDRILFGSDFPNLPYDYGEQIRALRALELDEDAYDRIFAGNAKALLGLSA